MLQTFTDIHCHIIPGVDDGPATLEDSLVLAGSLVKHGFTRVVATPHYAEDYSQKYQRTVENQFARLSLCLREFDIPLTLFLGGELLLTPALLELAAEQALPTLNDTCYVLLELPMFQPVPLYAQNILFKLQCYGYKPILAHPERLDALQDNIFFFYNLVKRGICLQINLGSLGGLYGQAAAKMAEELLKYDLVQFIGSDSHDSTVLTMMAEALTNPSYSSTLITDNPEKALRDEPVSLNPRKPNFRLRRGVKKFKKS